MGGNEYSQCGHKSDNEGHIKEPDLLKVLKSLLLIILI